MAPLMGDTPAIRAWQEDMAGFIDRIAAYSCHPFSLPATRASMESSSSLGDSSHDSMVVRPSVTESSMRDATPRSIPGLSVASSSSAQKSLSSISGNNIPMVYHLEEDDNGSLVASPSNNIYHHCMFGVLGCSERFEDAEDWKCHVTSHFRGYPPPTRVTCLLCRGLFEDHRRGVAWINLLNHILHQHPPEGNALGSATPGLELMHYLFCLGIITQEELRRIQVGNHAASNESHPWGRNLPSGTAGMQIEEPYFLSASRQREQRMRAPRCRSRQG